LIQNGLGASGEIVTATLESRQARRADPKLLSRWYRPNVETVIHCLDVT